MTSHLRLLPVSPLKLNVLQNNSGLVNNANNSNIVNNPNQNLLKINSQTITAKADSTHDSGDSSGGDSLAPVAIDPRTGVPFKKHHHSVKKFQTPSVSRRNARERNRVKQVNDGFTILRHHVPHLKNKTSKVDTLRAAVDYIRQLRCLLGQPIKDEHLHRGPVLITDLEDSQNRSKLDESFDLGSSRCDSALSNPDLNAMVYTLPPMMMMDDLRSSSPSSSISSNSNTAAPEVDSTNGTYFEDLKENMTQDYQLIDAMDLNGQTGQNNWNWTTVVTQDDQQ